MKKKIKNKIKEASFTLYAVGEVISEGLRLYFKKRREMLEKRSANEANKRRD
tara:strand:+ start:116 stop:271 length:156 start_codon:yes stop_codon:yes gene_type:complete